MFGALALLLAVLLAALGQWSLLGNDLPLPIPAWLPFSIAIVMAVYALSRLSDVEPSLPQLPTRLQARWVRLVGVVLMLGAVVANVWALPQLARSGVGRSGLLGWGGSLLLLLLGAWLFGAFGIRKVEPEETPTPAPEPEGETGDEVAPPADEAEPESPGATPALRLQDVLTSISPPLWVEVALVLLIFTLGIFMRVYRIGEMPPGIFVDEANASLDAIAIMEGRPDSPFATGWYETPTMYAYYLVVLLKLLGTTFTALKMASLLPSLLTLVAFYPLSRLLFGVPTALAATFLLAVNRWHINMSRWGWNEVAPLLFQLLALYFLVRGGRSRRARDFALGGLFLGLGMYTYLASRMVVGVVLAYLVVRIIVERGFLRRAWAGLLIFWVAYALTFAPLASTYIRSPFTFLNRTRQVSIVRDIERAGGSYEPLIENVKRHALMFHVQGDGNARHNLPSAPMLDPVTGILFLFGMGFALWRWQDHRRMLLLLWVPITLAGGIFSSLSEGPQAYRTLAVVPAVCLLAGDALARGVGVLASATGDRSKAATFQWGGIAATLLGLLVLAFAGWRNYDLFFHRQATDPAVYIAFSPSETTVAHTVTSHLGEKTFYLSPRLYYYSPLRYLAYRPPPEGGGLRNPPYRMFQDGGDLPFTDESQGDVVLLLDTHFADLLEVFHRFYPSAAAEMAYGDLGQPIYLRVTVPEDEVRAIRGIEARYEMPDGRIVKRHEAQIDLDWAAHQTLLGAMPTSATWEGSIAIPRSGVYTFYSDGQLAIEIGGQPIASAVFLGKGLHSLRVRQNAPAEEGVARLYWQGVERAYEVVPANMLFAVGGWEQGLRGTYFQGEALAGPPIFDRVDPVILFAWPDPEPWYGPFSARWVGEVEAPQDGIYAFRVMGDDGVRFYLDGQLLGEGWLPDRPNEVTAQMELTQGRHAVQIDFFQRGGAKVLEFWWQVPGQGWKPVPPSRLFPTPRGDVTFVQPETAPRPMSQPSSSAVSPSATPIPMPPLEARQIFTGTTESDVWEVPVGRVTVSSGELVIRILPVPGYDAVYDYLRLVGPDGEEQVFEAEDDRTTTGDEYAERHIVDGHWWLQTFDPFSNRQGLVAMGQENAPILTTILPLDDGEYDLYLGTFTGDPARGPFAIAVDYD